MKKIGITSILIVLLLLSSVVFCEEIKNQDKPLKGSWDFNLKKMWAVDRAGGSLLAELSGIKIDEDGKVFIFDKKNYKFFVFSPEGKFLFTIGKRGEGPGEYIGMANFFLVENFLIVIDSEKLHYFNKNGSYHHSVVVGEMYNKPPAGFLSTEQYFFLPRGTKNVNIYDIKTKEVSTIFGDATKKGIQNIKRSGGSVTVSLGGNSKLNSKMVAGRNTRQILVAKNNKYTITSLDYKGKSQFTFSIADRIRTKISEKAKEKEAKEQLKMFQGLSEDQMKTLTKRYVKKMPEFSNYFDRIESSENGSIYIYNCTFGNTNSQDIDIFSSKGKYLYKARVTFPEGSAIKGGGIVFKGEFLYVFLENSDGDSQLIKYKINLPKI